MRRNRFLALVVCPVLFTILSAAFAQDRGMDRGMDRDRGGGMGGGGMGVGTGIGLGIGIGRAISQQPPSQEPATDTDVRRVSKKKSKPEKSTASKSDKPTAPKTDTALKFDGEPDGVGHISSHHAGDMGTQANHQSVLVLRDGEYFRRGYYSTSSGSDTNWYWYEVPMSKDLPVTSKLPYVASCSRDADQCVLTKRLETPGPNEQSSDPTYIGWFWPFSSDPPPLKVNRRAYYCKTLVSKGPPLGIGCDPNAPGDKSLSCTDGCAVVGPEMGGGSLPAKSNYGTNSTYSGAGSATYVDVNAAWTKANSLGGAPPTFKPDEFQCRCIGDSAPD